MNNFTQSTFVPIPDTIQLYSSKNTSHLTTRLPKLHRQINFHKIEETYKGKGVVVDYGCGREISHISQYINSKGWAYLPYDPNWKENSYSISQIETAVYGAKKKNEPVIVLCASVLNVIDSKKIIENIKEFCYSLATDNLFFQSIYEGDKSNIGRRTKKDCWQRNETIEKYLYSNDEDFKYNIVSYRSNMIYLKPVEKI